MTLLADTAKPMRIQRKRIKGWRMPPNTVSVARPGKWGNPFKVAPAFMSAGMTISEITPASAVQLYREWIERALEQWPSTHAALDELRGKNLACFCRLCDRHKDGKPLNVGCADCAPCHVDPLGEIANDFVCEAAA